MALSLLFSFSFSESAPGTARLPVSNDVAGRPAPRAA